MQRSSSIFLGSLLLALTCLVWWLPNRPRAGDIPMPAARFNSLSFAPFRDGQSPLRGTFPTAAEVDADIALLAASTRSIRTYASIEGDYETADIAARHGVRLWKGAWLGQDPAKNEAEIARLIEVANRRPDTVERVIVGNEVLLRRDLPAESLTAALDRVRAAVHQPVTYADVWEFWLQFPELARHVDIVTIHILPYWEDQPVGVDAAIAHVKDVLERIRAAFPGKPVAIGEVGWPSRGRWRDDAAPSRVNQAVFLRRFIALAEEEHLDYNLIEAFDQTWKYKSEGTIGAAWGLFTTDRAAKFPLQGSVTENPYWGWYAGAAAALGVAAWSVALTVFRTLPSRRRSLLGVLAFALGNAVAFAWCGTVPYAFDEHLLLAAWVNLAGQAILAVLTLHRVGTRLAGNSSWPSRSGADATLSMRSLLRGRLPFRDWRAFAFEDLSFVFLWAAAVLQLLLLVDPRYRDFPFPTFAVPLVATAACLAACGWRRGDGGLEDAWAGWTLALAALASAAAEGPSNLEALAWSACAVFLALPYIMRARSKGANVGSVLLPSGRPAATVPTPLTQAPLEGQAPAPGGRSPPPPATRPPMPGPAV